MERAVLDVCRVVVLSLAGSACGLPLGEVEPACEGWRAGDVVLTELLPDPEGADTGQEWMEVHNPGRSAVDLQGLLLYAARADGSQERAYLFEASVPVEPKGYVVLGDVRSESLPAPVSHSYGDTLGALGNAGGLVGLRCGDVVVDEVRYSGPTRAGVSRIYDGRLVPDAVDNDALERWCDAPPPDAGTPDAGSGSRRSPGAANPACASPGGSSDAGVDVCRSPRTGLLRSVSPPRPGDLVITEFMVDPKLVLDTEGEWVEVYAQRDVDLNGVTLSDEGGRGVPLEGEPCRELRAGTYGVLARGDVPKANGGVSSVVGTFAFGLSNSSGAHALRLTLKDMLLDEVTWTRAATPGVSWQLAPSRRDSLRNDEETNFCPTPEGVGYNAVDRGTPGAENRPCVP
ncbi:hypothetical protein [Archangium sp.]|uniref:hypothetical protein n=1 Tax=Archangium sp. TaxID=1872627 RepID=UPI002ED96752